MLYACELTEV